MSGDDDSNRSQNPPNNLSNPPQNPSWPQDDNPFVAFRRFADEQISSMLQSVMGLPSMVSPPQPDRWTVFSESHDYNGASNRHREDQGEYPSDTGASGDSQSAESPNDSDKNRQVSKSSEWPHTDSWHWDSDRRMDNSFSNFFGFGSFFDRFWLDDHLPLSSRIFPSSTHNSIFGILEGDEDSPMWPVIYIMTSPYSPLQLERESRYRAHRDHDQGIFSSLMSTLNLSSDNEPAYDRDPAEPEWRDAFEDLLRVKYGRPMLDRESEPVRRKQPEKDWLAGLVERGSLGDSWKYVPSQSAIWFQNQQLKGQEDEQKARKPEFGVEWQDTDREQDPATELDMYERFIHDIEAREREFSRQFRDSPILRFLSDERHRHKEEIAAYRSRLAENEKEKQQNRAADSDSWIDVVSGGNKSTVPDTGVQKLEPESSAAVEQQSPEAAQAPARQPHVVSTSTTTERVRLADGSVHTKKVRTQRFADGREESNESVETTNPPQQDPSVQDPSGNNDSSGSGWFWSR